MAAVCAGIGRREPVVRVQPTAAEGRRRGFQGAGALPRGAPLLTAAAASEAGQALLRSNGALIECVSARDPTTMTASRSICSIACSFISR